jgi:hypothetical protein
MSKEPFNSNRGYVKSGEGLSADFGNSVLSAGHDGGILASIIEAKLEITMPVAGASHHTHDV